MPPEDAQLNSALSTRLEAAVIALTGANALKDRLYSAYCDHLGDIVAEDLPDEVQLDFMEMSKAMHRARALPGDSVVRASVRKLSNDEAQRFAALIVRMYGARIHSLSATLKLPSRTSAAARNITPLAALLAIDGGHGRTRPKHAATP